MYRFAGTLVASPHTTSIAKWRRFRGGAGVSAARPGVTTASVLTTPALDARRCFDAAARLRRANCGRGGVRSRLRFATTARPRCCRSAAAFCVGSASFLPFPADTRRRGLRHFGDPDWCAGDILTPAPAGGTDQRHGTLTVADEVGLAANEDALHHMILRVEHRRSRVAAIRVEV